MCYKMKDTKKRMRLLCLVAVLLVLAAACIIYITDYYHADTAAITAFAADSDISPQFLQSKALAYVPDAPVAGLIFYPGGKVEYTAYEPLMLACARQGILCVLIKMPGNLAVLDANAADGIQEHFPEIRNWYLGGHSLGGSMAAFHAADNTEDYQGLVLLAAYSTKDLRNTDLNVLSVYGSEDRVLNMENYNKNRSNLPSAFTEVIIDGGCHAYFGMYGSQDGDGIPAVSNKQQIAITAEQISHFIESGK